VALRAPLSQGPSSLAQRMTRAELLDAAFTKLAEVVKLLDSAGEELLAEAALELAERVSFRISSEG
jgi:hypothetical protein